MDAGVNGWRERHGSRRTGGNLGWALGSPYTTGEWSSSSSAAAAAAAAVMVVVVVVAAC